VTEGRASPRAGATDAGRAALARAAWSEALEHFESALAGDETPEALLGRGIAARSLCDGETALAAHERGYLLARQRGDDRLAARLALELAIDGNNFPGPAEAAGWMERAGRLLEGVPPGEEHGMLLYLRAAEVLSQGRDPGTARAMAAEGVRMAGELGSVDGEMLFLALEGLALVAGGEVDEGMRRLDEATAAAVAGEIAEAQLATLICCHLIDACKRVRDSTGRGSGA
jgi:hypothetical protein